MACGGRPALIEPVAARAIATLAEDLATTRRLIHDAPVHVGPLEDTPAPDGFTARAASLQGWEPAAWQAFRPIADTSARTPRLVRIGDFVDGDATPALLPVLGHRGVILAATGAALDRARDAASGLLLRLLAALPSGRVRFTLVDHLNKGGAFTSLLKLHKELLGDMVWHQPAQIDDELRRLVDHMSVVIQKYLTNQYDDIEAYNAAAGELVEAYRILAIADFPAGFDRTRAEQVLSIARNGARCGVYVVLTVDTTVAPPHGFKMEELYRVTTVLHASGGEFRLDHPVLKLAGIALDPAPPRDVVDAIVTAISHGATRLGPVKVEFKRFAPDALWQESTGDGIEIPIGRRGARDVQVLQLGRSQGTAHHALVAGKTGLGKTVLLHALVMQLALRYSPDELQLYLIDFKVGVEFEPYRHLPHARVLAIESEREFGLSVLMGLRAELDARGELFKSAGVSGLAAYRAQTGRPLPRVLAVIDEFQQFFERSDRVASQARALLDDLSRRGRSFGLHLVLSSQTLSSGADQELEPSTLAQIGLRIALGLSELDSYRVLARDNDAAYHLERPGEAIYNDNAGHVGSNSRFQVSYLGADERRAHLEALAGRSARRPLVFEGNRPAAIETNRELVALGDAPPAAVPRAVPLFLGEPATLETRHTGFRLRRQNRSNLLVVGQSEAELLAVFLAAIASFSLGLPPGAARIEVLDLTNVDDPLHEHLEALAGRGGLAVGGRRHVVKVIDAIADLVARRVAEPDGARADTGPVLLAIVGLQRARELHKEGVAIPEPARKLSRILRDGPDVGVHAVLAADTFAGFLRCLEQKDLAELDGRVALAGGDGGRLLGEHGVGWKAKANFGVLYEPEAPDVLRKFKVYDLPGLSAWCRSHLRGK